MQKKVIILYGSPGVGKLTVAQELIKQFPRFKLFHVHLLADLISSLFATGTKEFVNSFTHLWFFLFEKMLKSSNGNLVITLVYGVQTLEGKKDDWFFKKIVQEAEKFGAKVFFVKLECSDIELKKRVQSESRKKFKKITNFEVLKELQTKYKVDQAIPFVKSIIIETSKLSPAETTIQIKEKLGLK